MLSGQSDHPFRHLQVFRHPVALRAEDLPVSYRVLQKGVLRGRSASWDSRQRLQNLVVRRRHLVDGALHGSDYDSGVITSIRARMLFIQSNCYDLWKV